ncbi:MAG: hypothetical protein U0V74_17255 [Chitinophagales bacterium]
MTKILKLKQIAMILNPTNYLRIKTVGFIIFLFPIMTKCQSIEINKIKYLCEAYIETNVSNLDELRKYQAGLSSDSFLIHFDSIINLDHKSRYIVRCNFYGTDYKISFYANLVVNKAYMISYGPAGAELCFTQGISSLCRDDRAFVLNYPMDLFCPLLFELFYPDRNNYNKCSSGYIIHKKRSKISSPQCPQCAQPLNANMLNVNGKKFKFITLNRNRNKLITSLLRINKQHGFDHFKNEEVIFGVYPKWSAKCG